MVEMRQKRIVLGVTGGIAAYKAAELVRLLIKDGTGVQVVMTEAACGFITPGSREDQATFVCKNPDCGWSGNADWNAGRNVLHLYRIGHALIPAAGRAVVRRARRVKPATAR